MISVIIFIFGLIVGSFLNCVIYRLGRGGVIPPKKGEKTSPLHGRSYCPHCKHILSWKDLIPVLSFFILGGKCRYCGKKISFQYPLVELTTGILFVFVILNVVKDPVAFLSTTGFLASLGMTIFWILISCFLIIIFVYDLKHYIIPDKVIYPAILIVLLFRILELIRNSKFEIQNLNPVFSALVAAGFFLFIVLISKGRWMGIGDIKLAFLIGLFLGFPNILVALFFAFLIGAIIGIGLIGAKLKTLKSEVPFGPFLVAGTFIALFWGQEIIKWYLGLFAV